MHPSLVRRSILVLALVCGLLCQATWALAQTTGTVTGLLVDATTRAPIAGATIRAVSPSQSATSRTDARGTYAFVSLAPDTYTISAEVQGYEAIALPGITVQSNQQQTINLSAQRKLTTIGRVASRASTDLVRPGTTADVYSVNSLQQTAVQGLGGGGSLNSAYSGIASTPGTYVPQGQSGWAQSVYVRGGNYTQVGYEYDGIPVQRSFDQYPGGTLSSLGQQELQVYTGAAPASASSTGLAGFVNQVIRSGTLPGYENVQLGLGAPTGYHKAQFEVGGATNNRNFTYYLGVNAFDQDLKYGSQFNGDEFSNTYGSLYNVVATGCSGLHPSAGCYANFNGTFGAIPIGPNGYTFGPFNYGIQSHNTEREYLGNFHFAIPKKSGNNDDVQLLVQSTYLRQYFPTNFQAWGAQGGNILNGSATYNGVDFPNCNGGAIAECATVGPAPFNYNNGTLYTGPVGTTLTAANLSQVTPYGFPNSQTGNPGTIAPTQQDTYDIRTGIGKLQYQHNFNTNSFLRVYGYTFYSDWLQNGANSATQNFVGGVTSDYEVAAHTRGVSASYVNQINDKNLLNFSGSYTYSSTLRWNNALASAGNSALLVSSADPFGGFCYGAGTGTALAPVYCGSAKAFAYTRPSFGDLTSGANTTLGPKGASPALGALPGLTCGTGTCEYVTVDSGLRGNYNTVAPRFTTLSLEDGFHPNSRVTLNLGIRYDGFRYDFPPTNAPIGPLPSPGSPLARSLYVNSFNLYNCIDNTSNLVVANPAPGSACPAGTRPVNFSSTSPAKNEFNYLSPRVGTTYTVGPDDVLRASYGRYIQPASTAFEQYNAVGSNLLTAGSANTALLALGTLSPARTVYPEVAYNSDFSWEHQFKGSDTSFKLSPYYRTTKGEIVNVLLDPKTNFVSGINVGSKRVYGTEFYLRKGDFARDGFAALLSYTYTYGRLRFSTLPNGATALDPVNLAIKQYNAYTSFCVGHGTDPRCGKGVDTAGNIAAPCYTGAGAPDPACAAGSIANPYWNAPVQNLFDVSGSYVAYNQLPGTGVSSVSSSYIIPHVFALIGNYKRNRITITPSLQFAMGGQYGSPVNGFGIDPASGCGALAGTTAGDPRYQYGTAGGAPFNAATCANGLTTPDQFTKHFDNFGEFREPAQLTGNLQLTYQASKQVSFTLTAVNLYNKCFGGTKEPWRQSGPLDCWYGSPFLGTAVGNFFNPGDSVQPAAAYPYSPTVGNVFQQAYGGQANPFSIFLTANIHL